MSRSQSIMSIDAAIGINDGAYFIGRKEILEFLNHQLDMSLEKIEQTASGAVACQLMDKFFPGSIQIKRVNWEAKSDFQYIENYKILQAAFSSCNIQKQIDVDRLIRAKYQDNLEFCQWLKAFFEQVSSNSQSKNARDSYEPLQRRMMGKGGNHLDNHFMPAKTAKLLNQKQGRPHTSAGISNMSTSDAHSAVGRASFGNFSSTNSVLSNSSASNLRRISSVTSSSTNAGPTLAIKRNVLSSKPPMPMVGFNTALSSPSQNIIETNGHNKNKRLAVMKENSPASDKDVYVVDLDSKVNDLIRRNAELQLQLEVAEQERNFYFEKLRGIELMLQIHKEMNERSQCAERLIADISQVVCAKEEDEVLVSDDGTIQTGREKLLDDFSTDKILCATKTIYEDEELVTEAEAY